MAFDLLDTVEYGGCSAKLSSRQLAEALGDLRHVTDEHLLVTIDTHDDAGVYKISDDIALIHTTDFFTPICSDPYTFGRIAAANALSDVYAMGGRALNALNLVMFPSAKAPLSVLRDILRGGMDTVSEAGAVICGGHTIEDDPPKYGLAVTGIIDPARIITNAGARAGDVLVLSKAVGTAVLIAGRRIGETADGDYTGALDSMQQLNKDGARLMQKYGVRGATDITGFSLLGHALKMAQASDVSFHIDAAAVPLLPGTYDLIDLGCIPGACFRNLSFVENACHFGPGLDYNRKMALVDAQTSGGLLMSVAADKADALVAELHGSGYGYAARIGSVQSSNDVRISVT